MSPETVTLIWLVVGLVLAVAELVVPGAVLIFLGAGAVAVAGLRWAGLLESFGASFGAWLVLSLVLTVSLRGLVQRWSSPERSVQPTDEDLDAFGAEAEVVARLTPGDDSGRIRFRGTTWPARCVRGEIAAGAPVRIVDRENLVWIVEPLERLGAGRHGGSARAS